MASSFAMVGGEGPNSYSQNSTYQRALVEAVKDKINKAIYAKFNLKTIPEYFNIANFGCSVGPNTFIAVQNIINFVRKKYEKETQQNLENVKFQVFFNDQSSNDFNTLFRTLPPTKQYLAFGVPGSFYEPLLPKNSLHIGHCSYSLHWLSQVPMGLTDRNSRAWNKDIHCTGFVKEVNEAYFNQFKIDMGCFLITRAQELVSRGLMLLLGTCLPDGVQMSETVIGMLIDCVGSFLSDMAKLGLIKQEKLDSFNIPAYFAHMSEIKQVVEANGLFNIEVMEEVSHSKGKIPLDTKFLMNSFIAIFGVAIETSFGKDVEDKLMEHLKEKIPEMLPKFAKAKATMQFFILLQKN